MNKKGGRLKNAWRRSAPLIGMILCASVFAPGVVAAPPPGGGDVIQSIQPPPPPKKSEPHLDVEREERPPLSAPSGVKVKVRALRFTGNTAFSGAVLQSVTSSFLGKELTFTGLQEMANRITAYYRRAGYLVARAYLPEQDIRAGEIEVAVVEGRYGKVTIDKKARIARFPLGVLDPLQPGKIVREDELERGLLLVSDLPGVTAGARLQPGATTGQTDLIVELKDGPRFSGNVDFDNYGSRYAGRTRGSATLNLNNPLTIGDQLTLRATSSGGPMAYGRIAYVVPVNRGGTRLGLAYSHLQYRLGKELQPLEVEGEAKIAGISLAHPFVRSRSANFYGHAGYDQKDVQESFLGETTSRDRLRLASAGFGGDLRFGTNGQTTYGVLLSLGRRFQPELGSRVNADRAFSKLMLDAAHLQRLTHAFSVAARVAAQLSSATLVGAEQFSAGGPAGVRAYPQGEALGDRGYVASIELRWNPRGPVHTDRFGRQGGDLLQWTAFVESGAASLNEPLPGQARSRQLSGAGIGLNIGLRDDFAIKSSYAVPLDSDKASTAEGRSKGRFWIQGVKWF